MFYTAIVDNTSMTMENRDKIHMKDVFLKKTFIQEKKVFPINPWLNV